jgi:glutaconate CoA-transferase subunit A
MISALADAVDSLVRDGAEVALEGAVPLAVGRELLRRRTRDLTLISLDPGPVGDALVGAGRVVRLVLARTAGPRIRDALVAGWPIPVELEEHTQGGMVAGYAAGAAGLPFGILRGGYVGTDLAAYTRVESVTCPFTGEELTAVPALAPDLAIVHAPRADRAGSVQLTGTAREAVLAARRSLVTVDELVDELPGAGLPGFAVTAVAEVRAEAPPDWTGLAGERARFTNWLAGVTG